MISCCQSCIFFSNRGRTDLENSPGMVVRNAMQAKGWTQSDLAYAIGTTTAAVHQILSNKRGISHNMAKALAVALDLSAQHLAHLQADWDLNWAEEPSPAVAARAKVLSRYPLRDMIKRGWVDPDHGVGTLEEQICRFFSVRTIDEVPHLTHSAKKSDYSDIPPAQLAWLFRVRQIASEMHPERYSKEAMMEAIKRLKALRDTPQNVGRVPRILSDAGVRFVVVEALPGSAIDGVCLWLSPESPVIGMSLRFDRIDNFWFVLSHECAHVLHGHGCSAAILDVIESDAAKPVDINEEERVANAAAADFCVPTKDIHSFYLRKKPLFSDRDVNAFSIRMKVHPGLVVGQLQKSMNRYDFLRKYLVQIRSHLGNAMMMDGWGDKVPVN